MNKVFAPRHIPHRIFELQWHESCGHVTWRQRAKTLPDGTSPTLPKFLPCGHPLCPDCRQAQESPGPSSARLVASAGLKRLTAIGFGKQRREELKALAFQWKPQEGLWVFPVVSSAFKEPLDYFMPILGCTSEIILPKIPPHPTSSSLPPAPPIPEAAIITSTPGGRAFELTALGRSRKVIIGSISWPPNLEALPEVTAAGLPPHVPRILGLPRVRDLAQHGFTREELWRLIEQGADLGVSIQLADHGFSSQLLQEVLVQLPSQRPMALPVVQDQPSAKGGRPRTASLQGEEMLRRYQQGQPIAAIARDLGISARSVGRLLSKAKLPTVQGPS